MNLAERMRARARSHPRFNGSHYDPTYDHARLSRQLDRVKSCMLDGQWRTLQEIQVITRDPPASISAQLRHCRKKRFGFHFMDLRPRGDRSHGLYEYFLGPPGSNVMGKLKKESVIELKARIKELENENAGLKVRVEQLEKENAELRVSQR